MTQYKSQFKYYFEQLRARNPKAPRWFLREQVRRAIKGQKVYG